MPSNEIARVRTEENRYRVTRWSDKRTHQKTLDFHWPSKLYQFDPDVNQWRVIARWEGRLGNNKDVESVQSAVQTAVDIIRGEANEDEFDPDEFEGLPDLEEVPIEIEASYGADETEFDPEEIEGYTPPEPEEEEPEEAEEGGDEEEEEDEEAVEA